MTVTQKNVLFIEDDNFYSTHYKRIIEKYTNSDDNDAFSVVIKRNLMDALDYLYIQKDNIDVILLDLNLPDSVGYKTFQQIYDVTKKVPIIVITVLDDTDLAHKCVRNGAQDYLVKKDKFTPEELIIKTIQHSIYRKKIVEELFEYKNNLKEIVEQKTKELELAHRILTEVNKAQCWILRNDIMEDEIDYLASKFGKDVLNISRTYFFELIEKTGDKCCYRCISEWSNENQGKCAKDFTVSCSQFDFNGKLFVSKDPVVVLTKEIEHQNIRELFESHRALSIAFVPVFNADGEHIGILGFEDCEKERRWSRNELNALVSLATLISVVYEKIKQNEMLIKILDNALESSKEIRERQLRLEKRLNKLLGKEK